MALPLKKYDLKLSTEIIPAGMPNRPGNKSTPAFITIHNTDNDSKGADADSHSNFVRTKGYYDWKGKNTGFHGTIPLMIPKLLNNYL